MKSSYNGEHIWFSGNNVSIRKKIGELLEDGYTDIVAFLDVNPNNARTLALYQHLSGIKSTNETEIADALETDAKMIARVYELAKKQMPDYDMDAIYEELHREW